MIDLSNVTAQNLASGLSKGVSFLQTAAKHDYVAYQKQCWRAWYSGKPIPAWKSVDEDVRVTSTAPENTDEMKNPIPTVVKLESKEPLESCKS
jgi:hypothetical protein